LKGIKAGWLARRGGVAGHRFAVTWHVVSTFIGLALALALVVLEPFNLDQGLAERGRDLFYKVAAFAYPSERSPRTAVVTIDQEFLRSTNQTWPMTYSTHAYVLDEIASHKPAAIFIDMPFMAKRTDPTFDQLIAKLERIADRTPIYIAAAPGVEGVRPAVPEILRLVDTHLKAHLVDITSGDSLGVGDAYPISPRDGFTPAAVRIYDDLHPDAPVHIRSPDDEIDPWWALPTDHFNCRGTAMETDCAQLGQGVVRRLAYLTVSGFLPEPHGVDDRALVKVPYAPSIRAVDLFKGDASKEIRPRLAGAVVFYGADVVLSSDRQESPIQGALPGVYVHAMVYDNLVVFRGRYMSTSPPAGLGQKSHMALILLGMTILVILARLIASVISPRLMLQPHLRGAWFGVLDAAVLIGAGVWVAVYEFSVLHVGPGAWATAFAAALTGNLLATRPLAGVATIALLRRERTARLAHRRKPRWRR
jgi:CHASE2 domain-containing sensor protein